jgi:hypothetical protein
LLTVDLVDGRCVLCPILGNWEGRRGFTFSRGSDPPRKRGRDVEVAQQECPLVEQFCAGAIR